MSFLPLRNIKIEFRNREEGKSYLVSWENTWREIYIHYFDYGLKARWFILKWLVLRIVEGITARRSNNFL